MRITYRLATVSLLLAFSLVGFGCKPANRAPVLEGARIIPDDPNRETALHVITEGLYDPDGDELSVFIDWWVNNQLARIIHEA
jgi:hypothetical protein